LLVAAEVETMETSLLTSAPKIADIVENFSLLDEWDERYRYVIELGRALAHLPEGERTDANKVQGCTSQVWLATTIDRRTEQPVLTFAGDSDAHIVRGLVAILIAMLSGRSASDIVAADPLALFEELGFREHLTPQRSNGFRSMVGRMRADAEAALSATA
jgi:cysteine desulfuration protein SufE